MHTPENTNMHQQRMPHVAAVTPQHMHATLADLTAPLLLLHEVQLLLLLLLLLLGSR
jgi:hypothetical protein